MFSSVESAVDHVNLSFERAEKNLSKITPEIIAVEGMSGTKTRHFYNNLLEFDSNLNYLEIGLWKGSTFVSALYKNLKASGLGIDSFDQGWGQQVEEKFFQNCSQFLNNGEQFSYHKSDWYDIDNLVEDKSRKFDVYLFDSSHEEVHQYNAFMKVQHLLSDICVVIIDDWDDVNVRAGTQRAKQDPNLQYSFEFEKFLQYSESGRIGETNRDSKFPMHPGCDDFWNGIYVAVLKRKNAHQQ